MLNNKNNQIMRSSLEIKNRLSYISRCRVNRCQDFKTHNSWDRGFKILIIRTLRFKTNSEMDRYLTFTDNPQLLDILTIKMLVSQVIRVRIEEINQEVEIQIRDVIWDLTRVAVVAIETQHTSVKVVGCLDIR